MRAHQLGARTSAPEAPEGSPAPISFGPASWIAGDGAWKAASGALRAWPQPLGLLAEASLLRAFSGPLERAWSKDGPDVRFFALEDGADCDPPSLERAREACRAKGVRSLAGLGGGRVLDLAKLVGFWEAWAVATLPTSAATCACASSVAVLNDGRKGFSSVEDLPGPPALCLVETGVLRMAPPRLLASGLADTLAKWMEWKAVDREPQGFGAPIAWSLAQEAFAQCRDLGAEALASPVSPAFDAVVEACLLKSAAVSCLGKAPAAAAHSLANALSRDPASAGLTHGEAVGLGLLWQEALLEGEGRETMGVAALAGLLASWGLPTVLPAGLDLVRLAREAQGASESVHLLGLDPGLLAEFPAFLHGS